MTVGVTDAALTSVRSIARDGSTMTNAEAMKWLTNQLLLPGAPQGQTTGRVVALAPPEADLGAPVACRLRGRDVEAFLNHRDGAWWIVRARMAVGVPPNPRLVHVDLNLVDRSTAAALQADLQARVAQLGDATPGQSFVRRWAEYQQLENEQALREVHAFGYLDYHSWRRLDSDRNIVRFHITHRDGADSLLHHLAHSHSDANAIQLEATDTPPAVFGGSSGGLLSFELGKRQPVGEVHRVDTTKGTIELRMIPLADQDDETRAADDPPRSGLLFKSYRGDYRRLKRRERAIDRIRTGNIPMAHLLAVLEGDPKRGAPRRKEKPISQAVVKAFDGKINKPQEIALDIAVNTPDFAVIQGPPGTGKTELIIALQARLAELGLSAATVSGSMMLTSYQHAAVDNLVERSKVWDLPAMKLDSRGRGSTTHLESWRKDVENYLSTRLSEPADGGLAEARRAVARAATSYRIAPLDTAETSMLLGELRDKVHDPVSDDVVHRFDELRGKLTAARRSTTLYGSPRRESLRRAVYGLRYKPVSFTDDGPLMAARLAVLLSSPELTGLDEGTGVDPAIVDIVERAASWTSEQVPDFLPELAAARNSLLDLLGGAAGGLAKPIAREDVLLLFSDARHDLDEHARTPAYGVQSALLDYLEDLRGDPASVHSTLSLYTTSFGMTCQQADSRKVREAKQLAPGVTDDERTIFDTVIVDEAARANPLDLIIPLAMAERRIVLVGDHKQLPHMLEPDVERELRLREQDWAELLEESLFERLFRLFAKEEAPRAWTLNAQYRMHPVLGGYVSDNFYDGQLESPRPAEAFVHNLPGYEEACAAWLSVPRGHGPEEAGMSKSRPAEAKAIVSEVDRLIEADPNLTFGVISFYSAQVGLIREQFRGRLLERTDDNAWKPIGIASHDGDGKPVDRLQVGTVDAFQGKQFDVVLLSLTRSNPPPQHPTGHTVAQVNAQRYGHILVPNRLCVATSRQKKLLIMVGDEAMVADERTAPPEAAPLTNFWRLCRTHAAGRIRRAEVVP
jgi:hypothetical protein